MHSCIKTILCGKEKSRKASLLDVKKFPKNRNYDPNLGATLYKLSEENQNNLNVTFELWDLTEQKQDDLLNHDFLRSTEIALYCIDINTLDDEDIKKDLERWIKSLSKIVSINNKNIGLGIIFNQADDDIKTYDHRTITNFFTFFNKIIEENNIKINSAKFININPKGWIISAKKNLVSENVFTDLKNYTISNTVINTDVENYTISNTLINNVKGFLQQQKQAIEEKTDKGWKFDSWYGIGFSSHQIRIGKKNLPAPAGMAKIHALITEVFKKENASIDDYINVLKSIEEITKEKMGSRWMSVIYLGVTLRDQSVRKEYSLINQQVNDFLQFNTMQIYTEDYPRHDRVI